MKDTSWTRGCQHRGHRANSNPERLSKKKPLPFMESSMINPATHKSPSLLSVKEGRPKIMPIKFIYDLMSSELQD